MCVHCFEADHTKAPGVAIPDESLHEMALLFL